MTNVAGKRERQEYKTQYKKFCPRIPLGNAVTISIIMTM